MKKLLWPLTKEKNNKTPAYPGSVFLRDDLSAATQPDRFDPNSRVVIVANRLPTTYSMKDGELESRTAAGGLVSGLSGLECSNTLWIGWPGQEFNEKEQVLVTEAASQDKCYPVFLSKTQVNKFYNGFSNNTLWPLLHFICPPVATQEEVVENKDREWQTFLEVNELFAKVICDLHRPDDIIWLQDFHLMCVPELIRKQCPDAKIGWFLHTPWPSSAVFRMLPQRDQIIRSLLSANLLGFHLQDYVNHFLQACVELTGLEVANDVVSAEPLGRGYKSVKCQAFPIGIEAERFISQFETEEVRENLSVLREHYEGRKIILGVDRCDFTKGIPHKLEAFDRFLKDHPEWINQCVLVQLAIPTRSDVEKYQELKKEIHEMYGRICGSYGTAFSSAPIVYLDASLTHCELTALYQAADVLMVTALRDGMNLVSFEYVACQLNKKAPLILSEFTGAAQVLGGAAGCLLINPWDSPQAADAIYQALTMDPETRAAKHEVAWRNVQKYTSKAWAKDFLQTLTRVCLEGEAPLRPALPLKYDSVLDDWQTSKRRLIVIELLDILSEGIGPNQLPFKLRSDIIPPDLLEVFEDLTNEPHTTLLLLSSQLNAAPVVLSRPNQNFIYAPGNGFLHAKLSNSVTPFTKTLVRPAGATWRKEVDEILSYYEERTPGSYIDSGEFAITWNYENVQLEFAEIQKRALSMTLMAGPLKYADAEIVYGHRCVGIHPKGVSKFTLLSKVLVEVVGPDALSSLDYCMVMGRLSLQQGFVQGIETLLRDYQEVDSDSDVVFREISSPPLFPLPPPQRPAPAYKPPKRKDWHDVDPEPSLPLKFLTININNASSLNTSYFLPTSYHARNLLKSMRDRLKTSRSSSEY